jgi:hypothetical protein
MATAPTRDEFSRTRSALQRRLLGLLGLGFLGTGAELLLLDHTEGFWQKVPLGLITLSLVALGGHAFSSRLACRRFFKAVMLLAIAGGATGLVLHFQGNMEFELEMHPGERGWPLIWRTLKGATPALAPGMMILLGLLGLAATTAGARRIGSTQHNPTH